MKTINNRYHIIKKLGEGGMGEIYLADDKLYEKPVALKTIRQEIAKQGTIDRFKVEFEVMTRLKHPNLAQVYDFGFDEEEQNYFLAMEYIEGVNLREWLETERPQRFSKPLGSEMDIFIPLLRAIEFIHSRKILHRDIKPENIMIMNDEELTMTNKKSKNNSTRYSLKVLDFGLADLSKGETAETKGTLAYFAPEILDGQADERTDIFALGMTFYRLLTGHGFYGKNENPVTALKSRRKFRQTQFVALESLNNSPLKDIVAQMTAYEPTERYQICSEIIADINEALGKSYALETEKTRNAYVLGADFVGRDREFNRLTDFLASEDHKLLRVHGEAGIGKSRLYQEFQHYCQLQNIPFLQGDSLELGQRNFGAFLPILREALLNANDEQIQQYGGELKKLLPDHERFRTIEQNPTQEPKIEHGILIQNITNFLLEYAENRPSTGSGNGKIVFYLNDMHWADSASVAALEELMYKFQDKNLPGFGLRIYASSRPEGLETLDKIKSKDRLIDLELSHFDEQNVQSYIEAIFGDEKIDASLLNAIPDINRKVGGNPFFLQELIKSLVDLGVIERRKHHWQLTESIEKAKVPTNLKDLILCRLERLTLSDDEQRILQILALMQYPPTFQEFRQIVDVNHEFLRELERVEIVKSSVIDDKITYRTAHDLIREVVVDQISDNTHLHEHIAEKIEEIHTDNLESHIQDLAYHYSEAGNREKGLVYLEKAGDQAKANYQNQQAIEFYDRLLEWLATDEIEKEMDISMKKAKILRLIGEWNESQKIIEKNLNMAEKRMDKFRIAIFILDLSALFWQKGDYEPALPYLKKSLRISQELDSKKIMFRVLGNIGNIYYFKSDYDKALEYYEREIKMIRELGSERDIASPFGNMGNVYANKGDFESAMACYEKQLTISEKYGDKEGICAAVSNMGNIYTEKWDYQSAMKCYEQFLEISQELGNKLNISSALGRMGVVYLIKGDYPAAMKYLKNYLKISQELGDKHGISIAFGNIGLVYKYQGNLDKAMEYYKKDLELSRNLGDKNGTSTALGNIGLVYKAKGDYESALAYYDQTIKFSREIKNKYYFCDYLIEKAEILYLTQRFAQTHNLIEEGVEIAQEIGKKDTVFRGKLLSAKIDFALELQKEAVKKLSEMLANTENKTEMATLHYELYQFKIKNDQLKIDAELHREKALELYQELYEKISKFEYKKRIEELEKYNQIEKEESALVEEEFGDAEDSFM